MGTKKVTIGGVQGLPKEVLDLCKKAGIKPVDVAEYRVGGREPRKTLNGGPYWVVPVYVLTVAGAKYTGEVTKFNDW